VSAGIHVRVALDTGFAKDRNEDLGEAVDGLFGPKKDIEQARATATAR
jgi:hypothetical protein